MAQSWERDIALDQILLKFSISSKLCLQWIKHRHFLIYIQLHAPEFLPISLQFIGIDFARPLTGK